MPDRLKIVLAAAVAALSLNAHATMLGDLTDETPVDSNTIAVAYSQITNAIAMSVRLGLLDQESLNRAIQVGQDLQLIDAGTNGWVVKVGNLVEAGDVSVPGTLFLGGRVYGSPRSGDYIILDGCSYFYKRQIPGVDDEWAGFGDIVTDPYLDWRLRTFYSDWAVTNRAMWAAIAGINDLPSTLVDDLQTFNSVTNIPSQVVAVRDEINATNAVIFAAITNAFAQAATGGGQAWTVSTTSAQTIPCADHCIVVCDRQYNWDDYAANEITIVMPVSTGTAHGKVVFLNAYDFGEYGGSINYSYGDGGSMFCDDSAWGFQQYVPYWDPNMYEMSYTYVTRSVVEIDIQEAGSGTWLVTWKGYNY